MDGDYLAPMSIFQSDRVCLVEQALLEGPENVSTGKQVWDAVDRVVPEHTGHLILGDMANTPSPRLATAPSALLSVTFGPDELQRISDLCKARSGEKLAAYSLPPAALPTLVRARWR